MEIVNNRFTDLLEGYKSLSLTKKELAEFYSMVNDPACAQLLEGQFDADILRNELKEGLSPEESARTYQQIRQAI